MIEPQTDLITAAREFVKDIFQNKVSKSFKYHNMDHTEQVVRAAEEMADYYQLQPEDRNAVLIAAWFHDTGYSKGEAAGHEEESGRIAADFLASRNVDDITIQRITSCIKATRMPQSPVSLVEQILCDSDLYHLATDDFKARNALLKQEQEALLGHKIAKKEWRKNNVQFLETHKYFTQYGKENLEPKKHENLNDIRGKKERKEEAKKVEEEESFPYVYKPNLFSDDEDDLKAQQKNTERGIQTMFRTTSNNHFQLSSLADGKANIMISVNAIILSVVLTVLLVRLPFYPEYTLPAIVLVITCLSAMIFAILATKPSVNSGRFTEEDIRSKKTNLLFFGNFYRMKTEEYQWGMNEMLKDREYLYNSMIRDIYYLGVVLAKKYRLLRVSYTIFMWGLIATVVAFAVAAILSSSLNGSSPASGTIDY